MNIPMTLQIIKARFIGQEGSCGFHRGSFYTLGLQTISPWSAILTGASVILWRIETMGRRSKRTFRAYNYIPYKDMSTVLQNWDDLSIVEPETTT